MNADMTVRHPGGRTCAGMAALMVAVPAVAAYALFRNRVDERIAETSLRAEHVFSDYKLLTARKKIKAAEPERPESRGKPLPAAAFASQPGSVPPVAIQRERRP